MGAPMARRLVSLGYRVIVCDVNRHAVQSIVACGAQALPTPKAIASEAKLVLTCLPSLDALRKVVLGEDGLIAGTAIETYVDFSTTGSEFARELATELKQRGVMMLDSPVTGNVITAGNGKLGIMCSGPHLAYRQAGPVMKDLASTIVLYLGEETGRAQTLKLLNNLLSATGMAASCEAFILGVKAGLDPQVMLEIINAGDASSSATRNKFPKSILPRRFDFGARMAITAKDTSLTVSEAEDLGVPMWIGQSVRQLWKYAVSQGGSEKDGTALITFLEPWAKIEVRTRTNPAPVAASSVSMSRRITEYVLICESQAVDCLERRLRAQNWTVALPGTEASEAGPNAAIRRCAIVGVGSDDDVEEAINALPALRFGSRTIVNACLVASTRAKSIAQALDGCGDSYLDALFTGTVREIEAGKGNLLAGGSSPVFAQAKDLLEAMAPRLFHVSESPGAAQLLQQINGSLFATLLAATCESYVAGAKAGLDPLTMSKILGVETGKNAASARIIPEQVATRNFDYGKRVADSYHELTLVSDEARRLGVTTWLFDKSRLLYGLAAALGSPADDVSRLITHYEKWANVEVSSTADAAASIDNRGARD
jgi:3-hydroxyisobutyrate dehydrogenase-like beta-hydroxyacid dehydrogenase